MCVSMSVVTTFWDVSNKTIEFHSEKSETMARAECVTHIGHDGGANVVRNFDVFQRCSKIQEEKTECSNRRFEQVAGRATCIELEPRKSRTQHISMSLSPVGLCELPLCQLIEIASTVPRKYFDQTTLHSCLVTS